MYLLFGICNVVRLTGYTDKLNIKYNFNLVFLITRVIYNTAGTQVQKKRVLREDPILLMMMVSRDEYSIIYW
jgi:hypothetical protein